MSAARPASRRRRVLGRLRARAARPVARVAQPGARVAQLAARVVSPGVRRYRRLPEPAASLQAHRRPGWRRTDSQRAEQRLSRCRRAPRHPKQRRTCSRRTGSNSTRSPGRRAARQIQACRRASVGLPRFALQGRNGCEVVPRMLLGAAYQVPGTRRRARARNRALARRPARARRASTRQVRRNRPAVSCSPTSKKPYTRRYVASPGRGRSPAATRHSVRSISSTRPTNSVGPRGTGMSA